MTRLLCAVVLAFVLFATRAGAQTPTPTQQALHVAYYMSDLSRGPTDGGKIGRADEGAAYIWNRYAGNPILGYGPQAWNSTGTQGAACVQTGATITCLTWGVNVAYPNATSATLGAWTSSDGGFSFSSFASNPVVSLGSQAWSNGSLYGPKVYYDTNESNPALKWKGWYGGNTLAGDTANNIGYMTSADGLHWSPYGGNPIFGASAAWPSYCTADTGYLEVINYGGLWYLFKGCDSQPTFHGRLSNRLQVMVATSPNPFGPFTPLFLVPIIVPQLAKDLPITAYSGTSITVASGGTVFANQDVVAIGDDLSAPFITQVQGAPTSTHITVADPIPANYSPPSIRALCVNSVAPNQVYYDGTQWRMVIQCIYPFFNCAASPGACPAPLYAPGSTAEVYATSPTISGNTWVIDYTKGPLLNPPAGEWDYPEASYIRFLQVATPGPTTPTPTATATPTFRGTRTPFSCPGGPG